MRYFLIILVFIIVGCNDISSDSNDVQDSKKAFDFALLSQAPQAQQNLTINSMARFYLLDGKIGENNAKMYLTIAQNAESTVESTQNIESQDKPFANIYGKIVVNNDIFIIKGDAEPDSKVILLALEHRDKSQILEANIFENGEVSGTFNDSGFFPQGTKANFKKSNARINEITMLNESTSKAITGKDYDGSKRDFTHNISVQIPTILGDNDAITTINESLKNSVNFEPEQEDASYNFEGISRFDVEYIDDKVIVFNHYIYVYSGGAHGSYSNDGIAFWLDSGESIPNDAKYLLKNENDKKLLSLITKRLKKEYGDTIDTPINLSKFKITNDGVEFYWGIYEIAPYAAGIVSIKFAFSEIAPFVREDCLYFYKFQ